MHHLLSGVHQVFVIVLDVNDYRPRFTDRVFNTSVFENEPSGTSVITVKAIDLDEGENGVVFYSMLGNNSGNVPLKALSEHYLQLLLILNKFVHFVKFSKYPTCS